LIVYRLLRVALFVEVFEVCRRIIALRRTLKDLREERLVTCTGRGKAARWSKTSRTSGYLEG
jgi:pullulanase/glycogen debranching enzyme